MTLIHSIATTIKTSKEARSFIEKKFLNEPEIIKACKFTVGYRAVIIVIEGNGAVLRDIAVALDRAGHLD